MKQIQTMAGFASLIVLGAGCAIDQHTGYWPPPHPGLPPSRRPLPPPPVVVVQRSEYPRPRPRAPGVEVVITAREREIIERYVRSCENEERDHPHGKRKGWRGRGLPPGLAKKVDQGRPLPPGWERGLVKGAIMPVEIYQQCHSLPAEVVVQLPPMPSGTIIVAVDGRIVRLIQATRMILDVFEVGR